MSTETIVIVGASYAGLNAAHYALKHVLPQLPKKDGTTYNVTLINPSKDLFWRVAAPRAILSDKLFSPDKLFYPIEPGFKDYPAGSFTFVHGTATGVDASERTVSVTTADGEEKSIPYAALIISTGFRTPSPLFTQTTDAAALKATYEEFRKALASAKEIVIGGAGPVGVETAGEIGEFLNGKPGLLASVPKNPKAKITLICADKKMLPILREAISKQGEKLLKRLGAEVVYNTRVVDVAQGDSEEGKAKVTLSDGKVLEADLYIDATGGRPQTGWLPKDWLDQGNKVSTNAKTLRVDAAGPRVYAVGDVGSYTRGGILDLNNAIPVALTNLKIDLTAHLTEQPAKEERHYTAKLDESQICPIGTTTGIGAFGGFKLPGFMVHMIKGKDYFAGQAASLISGGGFKKEGKWKPQPLDAAQEKIIPQSSEADANKTTASAEVQ